LLRPTAGPASPGPQPDRGGPHGHHVHIHSRCHHRAGVHRVRTPGPGRVPGRLHRLDPRGVCAGPAPVRVLVPAAPPALVPSAPRRHRMLRPRPGSPRPREGRPSPAACAPSRGSTSTRWRKSCSSIPRPFMSAARAWMLLRPPGRQANQALLVVLLFAFGTGVATVAIGSPDGAWVAIGHGICGTAVVLLIPWKSRVVRGGLRRARLSRWLSLLLAALEFLQVTSLITADMFMREIPGGTRARHRSAQLTCPNTDTDHSDQSVPVLFAPLFLEGHHRPMLHCAADPSAPAAWCSAPAPVRDRSRLRPRGQRHHDQRPGPRRRRPRALGDPRSAIQLAGSVTGLS
jgi:hypothetical protein